jgi:hypothetical protein
MEIDIRIMLMGLICPYNIIESVTSRTLKYIFRNNKLTNFEKREINKTGA